MTYEEAEKQADLAREEANKAYWTITDTEALAKFLEKKYAAWRDLAEVLREEEEGKVIP